MIYLDNAATTEPDYIRADYNVGHNWMNANSDRDALTMLDSERENIKRWLGLNSGKILFCRSATEAVEWLSRWAKKQHYIACSPYEHDSVWDNRHIVLDGNKNAGVEGLFAMFQMVNQMTGSVLDIKAMRERYSDKIKWVGCDMTATIGKWPIPKDIEDYVDVLWFSGHKIHTEKNIACIWVSDKLFKAMEGKESSRNEYGLIHGTPDVQGAMALSDAVMYANADVEKRMRHYEAQNEALFSELSKHNIRFSWVEYDNPNRSPAINAITLFGIDADALTTWLGTKEIYIGKGASACAEENDYRVLSAFGVKEGYAEHTVRISYEWRTRAEDIVGLVDAIAEFQQMFC